MALSQIAAIFRSKEEFKKAAEYFGRVVGIAPESGDVWGALGASRACHGQFVERGSPDPSALLLQVTATS